MEMPFECVGLDGHFFGGHMSNLIKKIVFVQFLYEVELPICCVGSCSDIGSNTSENEEILSSNTLS